MKSNRPLVNVYSTELSIAVENCAKLRRPNSWLWGAARAHSQVSNGKKVCMQGAVRACSACAGDYEDPDRTASMPGESDDEEGTSGPPPVADEFPAET
jgi:hypothetical protein